MAFEYMAQRSSHEGAGSMEPSQHSRWSRGILSRSSYTRLELVEAGGRHLRCAGLYRHQGQAHSWLLSDASFLGQKAVSRRSRSLSSCTYSTSDHDMSASYCACFHGLDLWRNESRDTIRCTRLPASCETSLDALPSKAGFTIWSGSTTWQLSITT